MKTIQCAHPPHHHNGFAAKAIAMALYYAPCFVLVEHSVCHEPISVLINVFMLLA